MDELNQIKDALREQINLRLFDECSTRIKKCLSMLDDDQIWWRPNEASNSIGNLILHLNGNVRQWILSGIFGSTDIRERPLEFSTTNGPNRATLIDVLDQLEMEVRGALERIGTIQLLETRHVQNIFQETPLSIMIHVTEHFSYHTGQIAYITKMIVDKPLAFYDESKL